MVLDSVLFGRKNNTVKVIDSIMGSGKTTKVLEWMDNNPNKSYIYVSPLLSEVDEGGRVHTSLTNVTLEIPSNDEGTKSDSLLQLLKTGASIACTHKLYLSMGEKHFHQMSLNNYTVIIDEEIDVIGGFDRYSRSDLQWLIENNNISISQDDGMVSWIGSRDRIDKTHKYHEFLKYCDSKSLYCTKRSEVMMCTQLPIKLFECAKEVVILTYMFEGNILDCFLRLKGFDVEPFTEIVPDKVNKADVKKLLTIVPPNDVLMNYSLSSNWYLTANATMLKEVGKYIRNVCRNGGFKSKDVLWTLPKSRAVKSGSKTKNLVRPVSYSFYEDENGDKKPCWIATQTRATNDYRTKKCMVHCYNRFPLQPVASYLQDYGHDVDVKVFATSELVQWAWRGCIRDDKPMTLAIGSKRMHKYFLDWLEEE